MLYRPLMRKEIVDVIEGRGAAPRVPILLHFWISPDAFAPESKPQIAELLRNYPEDAQVIHLNTPSVYNAPADDPSYRWSFMDEPAHTKSLDKAGFITDWESELAPLLADFPSADYPGLIPEAPAPDGRYRLGIWWFFFFERLWSVRSMENALMDFYEYPDAIHALFRKLCDFYKRMLVRAKRDLNLDGIFTSDDLGTQGNTFFSTRMFDEFFAPYYREVIETAHSLDMHFWLHTCGNVSAFISRFVELGVDVLHPIQKYAMDEREIAERFGDKFAIWAGFDVQKTIPFGTSEDVRRETRFLIDTYARKDGRFLFTLGNGATGDTPASSLVALFDEAFSYGTAKMRALR